MTKVHNTETATTARSEYPGGGVFHLRVLSLLELEELEQKAFSEEFLRDPQTGNLIFNQKTGEVCVRRRRDVKKLVGVLSEEVVDKVTHIHGEADQVSEHDEAPCAKCLPSTPELVERLLGSVGWNGGPPPAVWVLEKATGFASELAGAEEKNSQSAPGGSSE